MCNGGGNIVKERILAVFVISLMFGFFASSVPAIIYDFDAAGDMDDWTPVSGDWSIDNDELVQSDLATPAMRALVGEEGWSDYTIECKIMITSGSYTGVVFRAISDLEYYVFYINANENVVELWQHTGPGDTDRTQHFKHAPEGGIAITTNEWFDIKLVIEGTSGEFYVNGELQDSVDNLANNNGRVGAWAWTTGVSFDDFSISGPEIPELSVSPEGALPMTWGYMKRK